MEKSSSLHTLMCDKFFFLFEVLGEAESVTYTEHDQWYRFLFNLYTFLMKYCPFISIDDLFDHKLCLVFLEHN